MITQPTANPAPDADTSNRPQEFENALDVYMASHAEAQRARRLKQADRSRRWDISVDLSLAPSPRKAIV